MAANLDAIAGAAGFILAVAIAALCLLGGP
jgi:hypothetical protein